ncbi:glycoside hydrolase family 88/105 protein [Paenibacillus macerans]|uniref:Glycosyl Hydrolase Family 88 family protein n=1 Tax=Paenibacillus macerans TaxID=44252 RepID=A0A090YQ58_PAEMA|nr:glycoside hydrolase family 88 protein [Paenibacillus macerans]KFM94265.1 glycosyl Hydrolase Family 88 family protein [Paenibacillus macerans]MCY7561845.1 glycoside hydrolase family 88 protein [Paenibacillus macerans]MEC0149630.1 glycoside hydrolase family 88 protein [Paenibacillus macerans]SUD25584.1 glycoside hydrolase family protein [Paenibacillus macerans]
MPPYFHEYDAIARVAAGRVEPVLSAVAGRFVGANPPQLPVYRVHSRRGFKRLADCRYDMDLARRWPDLTPGQFVYVWGMLWCEQEGETPFSVSCYSPVKVYVNGALAFQSNLNDDVFPDRKAFFRAKTGKGRNDIVLEFTAAGTGCGGVFGTGSVKGAPLHFLNPTPEGRGCEGWVYSGPQANRWDRLPGAVEGERWGGSRGSGKREDAENVGNAENAKNHENCQNLVGMNQGCIYGAWHPQDRWSPQELEAGCFARLFGSEAKPGDKVFAWCKLETRKFPAADVRIAGHYEGAATVYIDGRPVFRGMEERGRFGIVLRGVDYGIHDLVVESVCEGGGNWGFGIDEVRELEQGDTGEASGEGAGAIATAQATEYRRAPKATPAFARRNRVRLLRPYPVEGMTETWLYAGPFSGENAPQAAAATVMDTLLGRGEEATFWRIDRPDCWIRPFTESPLYGRWNYPLGVTLYGLLKTGRVLKFPHFTQYAAEHIEQCSKLHEYALWDRDRYGAPGINHQLAMIDSLDDCGSFGAAMLEANKLRPIRGAAEAAAHIARYISHVQDRLSDGTLYRARGTTDFMKDTLWCDDLYMSTPFLSKYYELTGEEACLEDAAAQFLRYKERLFMPELQIMHHVYDMKFGRPNGVAWGRGNGWVVFSLAELLSAMPERHALHPELLAFYRELCQGYLRLQGKNGLWHQVLTEPDSYEEASCTSMFIYAFARGVRRGWLEETEAYLESALRGWRGLTESCIDKDGNVYGVCRGSGYSFNKYYYKDELTWRLNDTHGIGIVLLAGIEALQLLGGREVAGFGEC